MWLGNGWLFGYKLHSGRSAIRERATTRGVGFSHETGAGVHSEMERKKFARLLARIPRSTSGFIARRAAPFKEILRKRKTRRKQRDSTTVSAR